MPKNDIDMYVESKVLPEFRPVVNKLRELMVEFAPKATEQLAYGIPCYKTKRIFAGINPSKHHVLLFFAHGKQFDDKYKVLEGVGKDSKHIKFKSLADVKEDKVAYYLRQAAKLDSART